MSKHDESRREFLVGAAVGAGAVATGGLPADTLAQAQTAAAAPAAATAHEHEHAAEGTLRAFFNQDDAATIEAFAERLMPGAAGKPGARDANVINYIDLALAGAYSDQQDLEAPAITVPTTRSNSRGNPRDRATAGADNPCPARAPRQSANNPVGRHNR